MPDNFQRWRTSAYTGKDMLHNVIGEPKELVETKGFLAYNIKSNRSLLIAA